MHTRMSMFPRDQTTTVTSVPPTILDSDGPNIGASSRFRPSLVNHSGCAPFWRRSWLVLLCSVLDWNNAAALRALQQDPIALFHDSAGLDLRNIQTALPRCNWQHVRPDWSRRHGGDGGDLKRVGNLKLQRVYEPLIRTGRKSPHRELRKSWWASN
jgi:hypothetical protein